MATPSAARPGRTIAVLAVLTALIYGAIFFAAPDSIGKRTLTLAEKYQPRLGLDLEGGTSVILTPRLAKGSGSVPKDSLNQAVSIIRNRVDSFGVAESEVTTAGNNIVISIPGKQDKNILATVQQTAELRFRQVLVSGAGSATPVPSASPSPTASGTATPSASTSGTPSPSPSTSTNNAVVPKALRKGVSAATTPSPTPTGSASAPAPTTPAPTAPSADGITPALQQQFLALDCGDVEKVRTELRAPGADDPKKPLVTCSEDGVEKYILAPAEVLGTDVKTASATLQTNNQGLATGGWVVELNFTGSGKKKFADVTRRLFAEKGDKNRFAIVLDGLSVSAPSTNGVITNGNAEISGNFSQSEATDLANVLKFGALPLTFDPGEVQEVSATLGGDQLTAGLVAGVIGLLLVVLYSLLYYRGLGLVTVASLVVSSIITYGLVVLLGWQIGFRLSLAGIAGLIVAIGITADSFVVYFERIRDEVRDRKSLRVAVETGWVRARRTILAADFVSFLAAVVLYVLSVGSVRGFAFTLGLTTLVDIVVVFMFTKPMLTILARTKFFGQGHRLSGLDPARLGSTKGTMVTPTAGRRGRVAGAATSTVKEA
ncbi:MAG: preprotein translocase subunit SecD [Actinomycetota bacterium]|nr:preprotein translocase subunit SecD [Actinomycetota bacterium]